jgi:hypothetical protein
MLDRILRDKLNLLPSTAHPSLLPPTPSLLAPCRLPSNAIIPLSRTPIREGPVRIKCSSGWGKGIAECYARLPSTTILQLELRKERAGPFHHEFVVAYEQSGHIYRFDRRPDPAVPVDTIRRSGCAAFDTVEEAQLTLLDETSDCVLTLEFLKALDFTFIFQVCVGLQRDDAAERYTLQRYNCYFFSWTIILIAMRHAGSWERRLDLHWYMLSRDWEFGGDMRMSEGLWSEVGVVDVEAAVGEAAAEAMKSAVWNPYFVKFFDLLADTRQVNLRPILCQAASDDCLDAHWRKPLVMNVLKSLREILPPLIRFTLVRLMQNTLWWSSLVSSLQSIEDEDVTIAIVQEMLRDKFRETLPSVIVEAMLGSTVPTLADILSKTICQALLKPLSRNLANTVSRTLIDLLPDTIKVSLHKAVGTFFTIHETPDIHALTLLTRKRNTKVQPL